MRMVLQVEPMHQAVPFGRLAVHRHHARRAREAGDTTQAGFPADFAQWQKPAKQEFLIDILLSWYASYFASWRDYAAQAPDNVLALRFTDLLSSPVPPMRAALKHSGIVASEKDCLNAFNEVWSYRTKLRFNEGRIGRGREYFTAAQRDHITNVISRYGNLSDWHAELLN
jgi:hypothetical protein